MGINSLGMFFVSSFSTLKGVAGITHESDAVAHSEYMCVYSHGRLVEYDRLDDVGCFASHSGQFDQFFKGTGHFAVKVTHQHSCHAYQVF